MNPRMAPLVFLAASLPVLTIAAARGQTVGPERGTLVIAGGGKLETENIFRRFVAISGGRGARILIVPTAASGSDAFDYENQKHVVLARDTLGLPNVAVLHTHDRRQADSQQFVEPIREAEGVWFTGGRQWRLADAYLGTLAETEFHNVLKRGGVIGGTSAGASIQASFLVRGDTRGNAVLIGNRQRGFGFLRNAAIDQHVISRNRQRGLIEVLEDAGRRMDEQIDRPALLGIGIDEETAIVVQGDQFEVIGSPEGAVLVYDPKRWTPATPDDEKYRTLGVGSRFDLKRRRVLE